MRRLAKAVADIVYTKLINLHGTEGMATSFRIFEKTAFY